MDNLKEILEKHAKWCRDEDGGERSDLWGADLQYADLQGADLRGANLQGANLQRANLRDAYLRGADLRGSDLRGAYLRGANLQGANLQRANLQGAYLQGANLRGADLQGAYLQGAYLQGANLQRANLRDADLQGANLRDADLRDANLRDAKGFDINKWLPDIYILKNQPPTTKLTAYKFLNSDLTSPYQSFQYELGKTYSVKDGNKDEYEQCGAGLNVATLSWCLRNKESQHIIVQCSFLAKDILAIPYATDGKFRLKKMTVDCIVNDKGNAI